jgi:hypothetical protein
MERLMRRRDPDKGLMLIGDAAAEDSDAKYFLAMLKPFHPCGLRSHDTALGNQRRLVAL